MKIIISPVPYGCGAHVFHKTLEKHINGYSVSSYSPKYDFAPFLLPFRISVKNADLVHTTADHGLFFYKENIPLVLTVHHYMCDGTMDPYSTFAQKVHYRTDLKWFIRKSISRATAITAVSRFSADHIRKELKITKKIHVIYNGIDTSFYKPEKIPQTKKGAIRVLFSGNHSKRKGFHWLPHIAARLNPGVTIYHTGGLRKAQAKPLHSALVDLGNVPHESMPSLYNQHDILVSPTVREGFGLAIAEAMACGLPVVASDCSAIPELIDHGKGGYLCPVGDIDSFSDRINQLADSPNLRQKMGEYNREKIERCFNLKTMIKTYRNLFNSIAVR